jgi:outer membrane protein
MIQMRKIILSALVFVGFAAAAFAQAPKFGHISVADVVLQMPEYKNISTVMEGETKKFEDQLVVMREELQKIELEYEKNFETYSDAQRAAKEEEYMNMQQRIQEFFVNAQQTLQQKQNELQVPVLESFRKAVEAVGEENGFLYIFEINSGLTLFNSSQSVDVTPLVKAKLGI